MIPTVDLPAKLVPVFDGPAMYRGAYGGRGSAKTRTFAKMSAVWGLKFAQANMPGVIVCGREFMNSLDESSLAEVKAAIASEPWLAEYYDVGEKYVRTKDGRIEYDFIGLRRNLDSIKSKARIRLLWVDEAEPVSETAWAKAIPTVREDDAEIWVTWNPERKNSATHKRFRADPPSGAKIAEMNWRDNPWFPDILNKTRLEDKTKRPDQYQHVWEGEFVTVADGAYFAASLNEAKAQGRICNLGRDPLMALRAFWDIGGTGARADACSIWVAQFIGREIRVLDYYEAQGQPLAAHIQWLRDRGYGKAECVLPHDGATNDRVHDVSFESALRGAGFAVTVIPNQGAGAAKMRIEAARRLFPSIWFNAAATESGRDALGWYHEKRSDDDRDIGLGPEHDWCLEGSTLVLTPSGWRPIKDLCVHDQVLTPSGTRRVLRSGVVRWTNEWTNVRGIRATPEHRFFTSRGLVEAGMLSSKDRLWTRDSWGLRILGYLCAGLSLGLKTGIISATPEGKAGVAQSCFIAWYTRLFLAKYKMVMRSTTRMATRLITIPTILKRCQNSPIGVSINLSRDIYAHAGYAGKNLAATKPLARGAVKNASVLTAPDLNGSVEPAYNITVDVDECYFVLGSDGKAYLVSNSSHGADAFGLMCVAYEKPRGKKPTRLEIPKIGVV